MREGGRECIKIKCVCLPHRGRRVCVKQGRGEKVRRERESVCAYLNIILHGTKDRGRGRCSYGFLQPNII
jgi:hypothetical protein